MQDKNLHIDKKIADQAWSDMKALLDKEMPVERKEKKPFIWWWSVAAGVTLILASIYFMQNNEPAKNNIVSDDQVEKIEQVENIKTVTSNKNIAIGEKIKNNSIVIPPNIGELNSPEKKSNNLKNISVPAGNKGNNSSIAQSYFVSAGDKNKSVPVVEEKIALTYPANNIDSKKQDEKIKIKNDVEKIDLIDLDLIPNESYIGAINPVNDFKNRRAKNSVYASTMFMPGSKSNGLAVGYLRKFKTGGKGFSIKTGVEYSLIKQPLEYFLADNITSTPVPGANSGQILNIGYSENNKVFDVSSNGLFLNRDHSYSDLKLHYFNVPLFVEFQKNRFYFNSGVQTSILLVGANDNFEGGLFSDVSPGREFFDESSAASDPAFEDYEGVPNLSNIDFSFSASVGFLLSKNFGLSLQYNHGMKDIIKNNARKDYNRLFEFSVAYNW